MSKHQYSVKGQAASHYSQVLYMYRYHKARSSFCYRFLFTSEENWEWFGHFKFSKGLIKCLWLVYKVDTIMINYTTRFYSIVVLIKVLKFLSFNTDKISNSYIVLHQMFQLIQNVFQNWSMYKLKSLNSNRL